MERAQPARGPADPGRGVGHQLGPAAGIAGEQPPPDRLAVHDRFPAGRGERFGWQHCQQARRLLATPGVGHDLGQQQGGVR